MPRQTHTGSVTHREGDRSLLAGVEVRAEDVDEERGLHIAGKAFRIATVLIILFAAYQAYEWLKDPPPGGVGMSVLIGDTVRLVVTAFLLYGAADLADLFVKNHYEQRATRILLARQTYLMRQTGAVRSDKSAPEPGSERRAPFSDRAAPAPDDPTTLS